MKTMRAEIAHERAIRRTDIAIATGDPDAIARAREAEETAFFDLLKLLEQAAATERSKAGALR